MDAASARGHNEGFSKTSLENILAMISFMPTLFGMFFLSTWEDNDKYEDDHGMSGTLAGMMCILYGLAVGVASGGNSKDLCKVLILTRLCLGVFSLITGLLILFVGKGGIMKFVLMYFFFALCTVPEAGLLYVYVKQVELDLFIAAGRAGWQGQDQSQPSGPAPFQGQPQQFHGQPPPNWGSAQNWGGVAPAPMSAFGMGAGHCGGQVQYSVQGDTPHFGGVPGGAGFQAASRGGAAGDFGLPPPVSAPSGAGFQAAPRGGGAGDFGLPPPVSGPAPGGGISDFGLAAPTTGAPATSSDFGLPPPSSGLR